MLSFLSLRLRHKQNIKHEKTCYVSFHFVYNSLRNSNTLQNAKERMANLFQSYICRYPFKYKQVRLLVQTLIIDNKPCLFRCRMTVDAAVPF